MIQKDEPIQAQAEVVEEANVVEAADTETPEENYLNENKSPA